MRQRVTFATTNKSVKAARCGYVASVTIHQAVVLDTANDVHYNKQVS